MFDLNNLKETNDIYGHDLGNKLLATTAKAISVVFKRRPVFRIGGDEFLVIINLNLVSVRSNCKIFPKKNASLSIVCSFIFDKLFLVAS